ncbi:MAG: hypothetical protein WC744_01070 [Patescibacteria group bacterium]|jgi:hypothetical protein
MLHKFRLLIISLLFSTTILIVLYLLLHRIEFFQNLDKNDLSIYVLQLSGSFYAKNYFKLFYNLTIVLFPLFTIGTAYLLKNKVRTKDKRLTTSNNYDFIKKYFYQESKILNGLFPKLTIRQGIIFGAFLIIVILFNFSYLLDTGIWVNYYHHNFIMGTINDLRQGKHLLVDTFNQYGYFFPYLIYLLFFIFSFSYMNLYLIFMILTLIYFYLLFSFLLKLTKNIWLSLLSLFLMMGVYSLLNYPTFPFSENYVWPGSMVLRYMLDIFLFLTLLTNNNFTSKIKRYLSYFIASLMVFYNLETGISLLSGFCFLIFLSEFQEKQLSFVNKVKNVFKHGIFIFFFLFLIVIGINTGTYITSGHMPNWQLFYQFVLIYTSGFGNVKTPIIGWYWIHLAVYFSVIIGSLYQVFIKNKKLSWSWLIMNLLSVYGLLLLNYYLGRSLYSNLTVITFPLMIILTYLFIEIRSYLKERKNDFKLLLFSTYIVIITGGLVIFFLSSYFFIKRAEYRIESFESVFKAKKYYGNRGFILVNYIENPSFTADDLIKSVDEIKRLTKNNKKILLLSRYDCLILVMAEKTHIFPYPLIEQIYTLKELDSVEQDLIKNKPTYLFIERKNPLIIDDGKPTAFDISKNIFSKLKPFYVYKNTVGILDIYKKK